MSLGGEKQREQLESSSGWWRRSTFHLVGGDRGGGGRVGGGRRHGDVGSISIMPHEMCAPLSEIADRKKGG